ncbi:MAG TPA: nuclear transport factor 2 family protein [Acidobacteriaceae bacterium]|jgi:ketosteroid isomerase-like protein|nr:nuclear transport factor 2 family protein [Acidobacteriaceae bacterium]
MLRRSSIPALRVLFIFLLCATLTLSAALPAMAQHGRKKTYKQVIAQLEDDWFQAQRTNDVATIDKLLSDDYIGISAQGMVSTKAQVLTRMQTRQIVINQLDVQDQKISIHGDTAVVTSQVDVDYTNNATQPPTDVHNRLRYTRVYLHYPSGTWRIVNFESTHIADLPGGAPPSSALTPAPAPVTKP